MKNCWPGLCGVGMMALLAFSSQAQAAGVEMPPDIKACEIVTGEEVAELAGGKMLVKPGSTSFFCNYVVEVEGGAAESCQLTFDSASSTELILEHSSGEEKGKKVDGILDEAYLGISPLSEQAQLTALQKGKLGMNVSGDREEVVLEIARLAATRLP